MHGNTELEGSLVPTSLMAVLSHSLIKPFVIAVRGF